MKHQVRRLVTSTIIATVSAAFFIGGILPGTKAEAGYKPGHAMGLVETVRNSTRQFFNVNEATAQGYGVFLGCVSSPHEGAMGVHFVNGGLIGDGMLDATRPEALVYEPRHGRLTLVAVEYVVLADPWHAGNEQPPVLEGQAFNYVGSPNRYGLPPFYELHVWAWKNNTSGTFADHNPRVSCDRYSP